MDWTNERYVRVYTRDTMTWKRLRWEGQCLMMMLFRIVDRSGVLEGIDDPIEDLALMTGLPTVHVENGLKHALKQEVIEINGTTLLIPNFLEAQEATKSDKQRQKEYRERRREDAKKQNQYEQYMRDYRKKGKAHNLVADAIKSGELIPKPCEVCGIDKNVVAHHEDYDKPLDVNWLCKSHHSIRHQEITKRDEKSREITRNNANKRETTPSHADPDPILSSADPKPTSKNIYSADFLNWYSGDPDDPDDDGYPWKIGKAGAFKAWKAAKRNGLPDLKKMKAKLNEQKIEWAKDNNKWVPKPKKYIEEGYYDNEGKSQEDNRTLEELWGYEPKYPTKSELDKMSASDRTYWQNRIRLERSLNDESSDGDPEDDSPFTLDV